MAVTTYNELYSLLKDNEVLVEYNKGGDIGTINLKATLQRDLIPGSPEDLMNYDVSIAIGDWALSGDSDGTLDPSYWARINNADHTYPDWLKSYSTNYETWVNTDISKIKSVKVIGA